MKKKFRKLGIGVDIGGSGIKGAPVDLKSGKFVAERLRIPTPENGSPDEIAEVVVDIVNSFELPDEVPVGITFPAPIIHGVVPSIANLSQDWAGMRISELFTKKLHRPVTVVNDADAAGFAEVHLGAAHGNPGTVMVLTLGTGIGSALVTRGVLVPNTELGHVTLPSGVEAEPYAASSTFEREELTFEAWAERLQEVFSHLEMLFAPDLFIVGGGVSKKHDKFLPLIKTRAQIVPAELRNGAGIVGAALLAHREANA